MISPYGGMLNKRVESEEVDILSAINDKPQSQFE
jgi:hypothetical protein